MQVAATKGYTTEETYTQAAVRGQTLGQDAFLKLLVAELTHQDPISPMQDREFITQMAQFRQLESIEGMSKSLKELLEIERAVAQAMGITISGAKEE